MRTPTRRHTTQVAPLSRQQRVLHALDRFTFGPRPGEAAAVQHFGLDAWFDQQLHPEGISDTSLEARLARFPAMQLTQAELIERFPTPGMLRQYSRRGSVEDAPTQAERAIYADAAFRYEEKREDRQAARAAGAPVAAASAPASADPIKPVDAVQPMDDAAVRAMLALPAGERVERLMTLSPEEMASLGAALKGGAREQMLAGLSPVEAEEVAALQNPAQVVDGEVMATRLLRDVYSERQLQAVMADFWLNHFNIYLRKSQDEPYLLPAFEREAVLPHALGRFEDLLVATAQSPAMLVYLDNWTSIGPESRAAQRGSGNGDSALPGSAVQPTNGAAVPKRRPKADKGINENYARELMELHTLGVNGGYTQQDVIEVARCFTGWTIQPPAQGGGFVFNANRHEPGPKTVLGHVIPEGGEDEGMAVLHILATSPATAHFLSQELAERFVSDDPPATLVNRMAAAFLNSDGDIATVLSTLFHSSAFWSPAVYRAKVKTPVEFVASALRAGDADVTNPMPLVQSMARLGMPVYGMQTPNGYSWQQDAWVSSGALLNRMNFALTLSGNRLHGTRVDWPGAVPMAADAVTDGRTEAELETLILGEPAAQRTRDAVLAEGSDGGAQQAAEQSFKAVPTAGQTAQGGGLTRVNGPQRQNAGGPESRVATMAGLLLGSPDFQRR